MKEYKIEAVETRVVSVVSCDACKKAIDDHRKSYEFTACHYEWHEDFEDTVTTYDVCSWACYKALLPTIYNDYKGRHSAEIDGFPLWMIKGIINE
jgi:hypothetical protein